MTDSPVSYTFGPTEPPNGGGWWARFLRLAEPAFYAPSWAPWVRIMITAIFVVVAVVYLRA